MREIKRQKNLKEKGITLIALVVTIVILLILAAVTINMTLGSNGLFLRARESRAQYENSTANEVEQMNDATGILEEVSKQNGLEPVARTGISVGDYIDYVPDTVSSYPKSKLSSAITGYYIDQEAISQDTDMKWQILKINNDGSIVLIGTPTTSVIYFQGVLGYNNGVYVLNDICKELYSKSSKGITARSVNLEDLENWLTSAGKVEKDSTYRGTTNTYTESNSRRPDILDRTNNESDSYYTSPTDKTYSGGESSDTLDVKSTYYSCTINGNNYGEGAKVLKTDSLYWLASRYVGDSSVYAIFGLRIAYANIEGSALFLSNGNRPNRDRRLRPVVTLKPSTQIEINPTASSNPDTPHKITQY